jgi:hypothetical protein
VGSVVNEAVGWEVAVLGTGVSVGEGVSVGAVVSVGVAVGGVQTLSKETTGGGFPGPQVHPSTDPGVTVQPLTPTWE